MPSFINGGRCWVGIGRRISFGRSPVRVLGLPLLPARTKLTAIRAFANSRLSSRAKRAPREPYPLAGSIPNMRPMRASGRGTDNQLTKSQTTEREHDMPDSIYDVITLIGTSAESWEKAASNAVEQASKTLRNLRVAEIVELDMQLDAKGKVEAYRAKVRLSFKIER